MFRWFLGLFLEEPSFAASPFCKNRVRLACEGVAVKFFDVVVFAPPRVEKQVDRRLLDDRPVRHDPCTAGDDHVKPFNYFPAANRTPGFDIRGRTLRPNSETASTWFRSDRSEG